jgi:hypothetical protein
VKHDNGKPRFDLIPPGPMREIAAVFEYGARKYSPDGWYRVEDGFMRYLAAAYRHINARHRGEVLDPESGLPHLAHAVTSLLFLMEWDSQQT